MHKYLPKLFIFLDHYNSKIFNNNNINLGIIYRNYNDPRREIELIKIAKACKKKRYQLFVSNDIKLALKVRADGIYIPSFNKTKKYLNSEIRNLTIIGSAHNQKEIYEKIKTSNPEIIDKINNTGELDEEIEKKLTLIIEQFQKKGNK